ncbi:hypothetical protein, variant [Aphanomyces invadans]|uniref:Uncharacterized protein n=1 Tax=Aphanomyces invadans TaxID=157072 RepID=A0A024TTB2_9STRA|nr:hypothetical protein, variant [Aphanomyces invadans]ETV97254.1 hypothetical protein, variant [Aphanomyces invadans]|eukprot:XP_008873962.1 hypothetical protein, variant [Aphanomyces invadans]
MEWAIDPRSSGVLHVALVAASVTETTVRGIVASLTAIPRRHSTVCVHVTHPGTAYSTLELAELVRALSDCFEHCPCLEWSLVGVQSAPALESLATLWRDAWCTATPRPRRIRLHVDGHHATAMAGLHVLEPYLTGIHVRAKRVAPNLVTMLGTFTMLTAISLDKMLSSWSRHLLATFLAMLAPMHATRHAMLPHLTALSLCDNSFDSTDVIAIASTVRYHRTLTDLSLAYSLPPMTVEMGAWLVAGLFQSPYSRLQSLNVSGMRIGLVEAHAMANSNHLVRRCTADNDCAAEPVPPGLYAISATVTRREDDGWHVSPGMSVVEVITSNAAQVAVSVPTQGGMAWIDRALLVHRHDVEGSGGLMALVMDDLVSADPVLVHVLACVPARHRLERLRTRRYTLTTDELREVLVQCPALRELDIKACRLADASPFVQTWCSPPQSRLVRLNLSKNPVGAVGAAAIFRALRWTNLQALDMSNCHMGESTLAALDHALQVQHPRPH